MIYALPESDKKSKDSIREHLARLIISGELKAEDILPNELALAEKFGVSRTMIRDVLKNLEGKGLIERKTNVGTRVRSIHSWNLLDQELLEMSCGVFTQSRFLLSLMELRLILEPQAAALAALRANDDDLHQIRENFSRMGASLKESEPLVLDTDADIEFHKSILKACGNLFISQFGSAIKGALHHTIYLSNKTQFDNRPSLECHRRIVDAIESRDPQKAYAEMCNAINNAITDLKLKVSGVILSDFNPDK